MRLAVIAVAVLSTACAIDLDADGISASGRFDRTLAVTGPVDLDVRTGSGAITIKRGTDVEVRVTGHIRAHRGFWNSRSAEERVAALEANPPIVQNGNSIRIGEIADAELRRNISISYELTVPGATEVRSRTGSGSVEIDSLQGPIEAHTGSGDIRLGQIAASVNAQTGSGSVDVLGAGAGLTVTTGSGSVNAKQVTGPVHARAGSGRIAVAYGGDGDADVSTGSGAVTVTGVRGRLRARTGSGSITVDGRPAGEWEIDAGSGTISVSLPPDAAFDLDATTSSGSIQTTHPIETRGSIARNRIQGRVRGGGPRLEVSSGSGTIRLN